MNLDELEQTVRLESNAELQDAIILSNRDIRRLKEMISAVDKDDLISEYNDDLERCYQVRKVYIKELDRRLYDYLGGLLNENH